MALSVGSVCARYERGGVGAQLVTILERNKDEGSLKRLVTQRCGDISFESHSAGREPTPAEFPCTQN